MKKTEIIKFEKAYLIRLPSKGISEGIFYLHNWLKKGEKIILQRKKK